jgi:glutamine amidotransferase
VTSRPLVAVLDYDAGNLRSAAKALGRAGADVTVTRDAVEAAGSDALVVPGVGHFGQCVRRFREVGLESLVRDWVEADLPLLGVCIGMQILYRASEEDPQTPGLGILPGVVRRLPNSVTVPHMGWNVVRAAADDPVLEGVAGERCYFVHSYYAQPDDPAHVLATTDYGPGFPSVVRIGATLGTQFHPEKSSAVGGRLLANFVKEAARPRAPA